MGRIEQGRGWWWISEGIFRSEVTLKRVSSCVVMSESSEIGQSWRQASKMNV